MGSSTGAGSAKPTFGEALSLLLICVIVVVGILSVLTSGAALVGRISWKVPTTLAVLFMLAAVGGPIAIAMVGFRPRK